MAQEYVYVVEWTDKFPPQQPKVEFSGKCSPETWARFWSKVYRIELDWGGLNDQCYWWKASCDDEGYPMFWLNKEEYLSYTGLSREKGGTVRVLGWLLFQFTGKEVKEGFEVHHGCHTPSCKRTKDDPHHSCVRHLVELPKKENVERGNRAQPQPKVPWWVKKDEWQVQKNREEREKDRAAVEKLKERYQRKYPQGPSPSLQGDNQYWQPKQPRPGFSVFNEKTGEHVHIPPREGDWTWGECGCDAALVRVFCTDRKWRKIDPGTGKEHWKVCRIDQTKFLNPLYEIDYEASVVPDLDLREAPPLTRLPPMTTHEQLQLIEKEDLKSLPKVQAEVVSVIKPGDGIKKEERKK